MKGRVCYMLTFIAILIHTVELIDCVSPSKGKRINFIRKQNGQLYEYLDSCIASYSCKIDSYRCEYHVSLSSTYIRYYRLILYYCGRSYISRSVRMINT